MASSKPTLNPLTDVPKNKTEVTKPFMSAYIKCEKASDADREWFKTIVGNPEYQEEKINRLDNTPYLDINIPKVREKFCERFFPHLLEKKKNKSFIEDIMSL
jgi:hypothetical protein